MATPSVLDILDRLIAFDTTSALSNLKLIDWVRDYLAGHGVAAHVLPSPDKRKANLFATIGPERDGGVALSGHTDVVPVAGQDWRTDPFQLTERDGRLYGRGTADMKSFLALALALVPEMRARPLSRPLHLAFSYDEEIGCVGAPRMIAELGADLPKPSVVFVGEPTGMKVVSAHKGIWCFHTAVTGYETHSSQTHRGVSAVMTAARLVTHLDDMARARAAVPAPDSLFDPPYTTIHVGLIEGGTATNIISGRAAFVCDIRNLPEDDPAAIQAAFEAWYEADILPAMRAKHSGTGIVSEKRTGAPGLKLTPGSEAETLARSITGDNATICVPFATEAGQFQEAGMAVVVIGPGSIDQAHQANEYIEKAQLAEGEAFLRKLIERCR